MDNAAMSTWTGEDLFQSEVLSTLASLQEGMSSRSVSPVQQDMCVQYAIGTSQIVRDSRSQQPHHAGDGSPAVALTPLREPQHAGDGKRVEAYTPSRQPQHAGDGKRVEAYTPSRQPQYAGDGKHVEAYTPSRQPQHADDGSPVEAYTGQEVQTHLRLLLGQQQQICTIGAPEGPRCSTVKRIDGGLFEHQESTVKHFDGGQCQVSKAEPMERKQAFETAIENCLEYKDIQKKQHHAPGTLKRKLVPETTKALAHQHKSVFSINQFQDLRENEYKLGASVLGTKEAVHRLIDDAVSKRLNEQILRMTNTDGALPRGLNEKMLGAQTTSVIMKKSLWPYGTFTSDEIYNRNGRIVWKCQHANSHLIFVRKKQHRHNFRTNEIHVVAQLNHENIVKLYGLEVEGDYIISLLENAGLSLVWHVLSRDGDYQCCMRNGMHITDQLLDALCYLENRSIIHADLKPHNICLKSNQNNALVAKIIDFGSCITPQDVIQGRGWTAEYMSPEACRWYWKEKFDYLKASDPDADGPEFTWTDDDMRMTPKTDMFSLCLIILFIYHRKHITRSFLDKSASYGRKEDVDYMIEMMTHAWSELSKFIDTAYMMPEVIAQLCRRMLTERPKNRISASEGLIFLKDALRQTAVVRDTSMPPGQHDSMEVVFKPGERTVEAVECQDPGLVAPIACTGRLHFSHTLCISSGMPREKRQRKAAEELKPEGTNNLPNFDLLELSKK